MSECKLSRMMRNPTLDLVSFHINNICNLNCDGCHTLSNYDIKGTDKWQDWKHVYDQWSKRIDVEHIEVYGGEPLLNPDHLEWMEGLSESWPNAKKIWLLSNGWALRPEKHQPLYEFIMRDTERFHLQISYHNEDTVDDLFERINNWLVGPIVLHDWCEIFVPDDRNTLETVFIDSYDKIKDPSWPTVSCIDDWYTLPQRIQDEMIMRGSGLEDHKKSYPGWTFVDKNNVMVKVRIADKFSKGPVRLKDNGRHGFHESNPEKSHSVCGNRQCLEFAKGVLNTCNTVWHFKDFVDQFDLDLSPEEADLINSYEGGHLGLDDQQLGEFIDNLGVRHLPQCGLCPEDKNTGKIIKATSKKTFILKRSTA